MSAAHLALEGLGKSYGDVVALEGLDLEVDPGELLVLVGPSGSGKSTALRCLAGLEEPSRGRVLLDGEDVTRVPPQRRDVAMVFQDYALYPHLTARENLAFGLRVRRTPEAEVTAAVDRVAELLGIGPTLDRYPDQLSGGQQQRVALGRAMVREPAVFLMDEPLSNLDAQLRQSARADVVELQRRLGTTTVYVTHDQVEAMTMGDRVAVLAEGRLQQLGAPQEVYDRPASAFVAGFLGSPPMTLVAGGGVLGGDAGTTVGVRPEGLLLNPDGEIAGEVVLVESLGSETVLAVRTCGPRLAVRVPPHVAVRPGDEVRLRVGERHVFDAATGARR